MASIENRSRFMVTVTNRDDLTKTFPHNATNAVRAYIEQLRGMGFKPKAARLNDAFLVRVRQVGYPDQTLSASSEQEALDIEERIKSERRRGLFVDYGKGRRFTFGDLLTRYLREEAPRHKGFLVEGYIVNAMLEDAGMPRVDMAAAYAAHKNPHPSLAGKKFPKQSGRKVRTATAASCFLRKSFAEVMPTDINDYIDERCQYVAEGTVDRDVDLFSAVCNLAIRTWRIPVQQSPMDGVRRPKYFNDRDRRLVGDEEQRLLDAAYEVDKRDSIKRRLEELIEAERAMSNEASTKYRKKAIIKEARARCMAEAEATYTHVPMFETFLNFQLMTGARCGEALTTTWDNVDFDRKTVFIPESKNGRPRKLPLRQDLVDLLELLPRTDSRVFTVSFNEVRKAWSRICRAAGIEGEDNLRLHDLRHEAISRVADANANLPGGFTLLDLQGFSGHRDTRMLLRYTHLCTPSLAKRLDAAFADKENISIHRGYVRLKKSAALTMKEIVNAKPGPVRLSTSAALLTDSTEQPEQLPSNVVRFPTRRAA